MRKNGPAALLAASALLAALFGTCSVGSGQSYGWKVDFGADIDARMLSLASMGPEEIPAWLGSRDAGDAMLMLAVEPAQRAEVLNFMVEVTGSLDIASAILDNCIRYGVPPSLALAVAHEESGFNPRAVHQNLQSVDRGLFQLNSFAFPKLRPPEVFQASVNSRYGISHLAWFLETAGNEVTALAMYNAGGGSVAGNQTPRRTLDYIAHVQAYRDRLLQLFTAKVALHSHARMGAGATDPASDTAKVE